MKNKRMYRNRLQIIADILLAAEKSPLKTHIMFQSNLNYGTLNRYLDELVEAGLLGLNSSSYFVTQKGRMFLDKFMEYSKGIRELEDRMNHISGERSMLENIFFNTH